MRLQGITIEDKIKLEIETLFHRLDLNGDGTLSEEELFKGLNASSHNKHSPAQVKEIMKMLDKDKNGSIDKEEFYEFMMEQIKNDILSAEDEMEDLRQRFIQYDLDGNGWLSPFEI